WCPLEASRSTRGCWRVLPKRLAWTPPWRRRCEEPWTSKRPQWRSGGKCPTVSPAH
ncbi:unnamed protein product, partial [Effrenium voratum]